MEVRPLREDDDRTDFSSGQLALDRFFREFAGQNQFKHHVGSTYVAVTGEQILAFVTVSGGLMEWEQLPSTRKKGLPRHPLPILRLARMAVDRTRQRQGIGELLLFFVFQLARQMATTMGCVGVVVDAKPEAVGWYQRYGFLSLQVAQGASDARPAPEPMFLPLGDIQSAITFPS